MKNLKDEGHSPVHVAPSIVVMNKIHQSEGDSTHEQEQNEISLSSPRVVGVVLLFLCTIAVLCIVAIIVSNGQSGQATDQGFEVLGFFSRGRGAQLSNLEIAAIVIGVLVIIICLCMCISGGGNCCSGGCGGGC